VWSLRAGGIFLAVLGAASAAEPTLSHLFPAAGQQGTTVSVAAVAKSDPWPPQVWVDAPGITFTASKTKGKFDVEIAKDAAPGPHLVRFYNKDGASIPRFFRASPLPHRCRAASACGDLHRRHYQQHHRVHPHRLISDLLT